MIYKFKILSFLLFLFWVSYANSGQYLKNISIMERDRKSDLIFLHEYYGIFDEKSQKIKKRSYLEILSSTEGSKYILENSPLFTYLYWFSKEEILVALSTISLHNNPQIVLYTKVGKELGRKFISCKNNITDDDHWCYAELNQTYWFENPNPETFLKVEKENVAVCVEQSCFTVELK